MPRPRNDRAAMNRKLKQKRRPNSDISGALSFLGLGIQPPFADWGGMVRENSAAINFGMLAPIWPALAISTLTVGVNLVVDWLLSIEARPSGAPAEL